MTNTFYQIWRSAEIVENKTLIEKLFKKVGEENGNKSVLEQKEDRTLIENEEQVEPEYILNLEVVPGSPSYYR